MKQQLLLFLSVLSVAVGQSQTFNIGMLQYTVTDATNRYVSVKKNDCSIGNLTIPNSITDDDDNVYLVTSIAKDAFKGCTTMTSITIPDSVINIGENAFDGCTGLTSVSIPEGVTSIASSTFSNCNYIISIDLPSNLVSIGASAFYGCHTLKNIVIPNTVTSIGSSAFTGCRNLTGIVLPDGITDIPISLFKACNSLESINIPNGVTSIAKDAFSGCESLKSIDIPSSVTSIGYFAFENCSDLESVTVHWNEPLLIDARAFKGVETENIPLFVPTGTEAEYQTAAVWKDFDWTRLSLPEAVAGVALRLHPNPVAEYLNIELSTANELKQITIYNNLGQLVSKENKSKIDISKYSRGLYIAQIETTKGKVAKKFIVQ